MSSKNSNHTGTATKSENSVLFSLDNLTKLVTSAAPLRVKPATAAPASEGSGLIEIRTIGAMLQRDAAPRSAPAHDPIPSFGGGGLGGLSAAPLAVEVPTPVRRPARPKPNNGPLYALLGLLGAGLLGLGAIALFDKPEPTIVTEIVSVPEPSAVEPPPPSEADAPLAVATAPDPEPEPEARPETQRAPAPAHRRRSSSRTNESASETSTKAASKSPPAPTEPDVDCLLTPSLDKCHKDDRSSPSPKPKPAQESTASLANKLDSSQIRDGIDPVKSAAKSCGSGTTVAIKFSVAGATGRVMSAEPLGEHASSEVGRCVAKAAAAASFEHFASKQQGFTFKFRL